jgi:hypothetical protein
VIIAIVICVLNILFALSSILPQLTFFPYMANTATAPAMTMPAMLEPSWPAPPVKVLPFGPVVDAAATVLLAAGVERKATVVEVGAAGAALVHVYVTEPEVETIKVVPGRVAQPAVPVGVKVEVQLPPVE